MPRTADFNGDENDIRESADALELDTVYDGVAALRDIESEAGDEQEVTDLYTLDHEEARELGAELDSVDGPEAVLD